ncbi:hypothetical protein ACVSQB_09925 [Bradyrhizobium elkanii]
MASNSNGYNSRQLPGQGTTEKISIITIAYDARSIPDFPKNCHDGLKIQAKPTAAVYFAGIFAGIAKPKAPPRIRYSRTTELSKFAVQQQSGGFDSDLLRK